jgi:Regulator of chromosome condensation (RCC1) repeat
MLGHGDLKDRDAPVLVKSFKLVRTMRATSFTQVAAGSDHTLALTGLFWDSFAENCVSSCSHLATTSLLVDV